MQRGLFVVIEGGDGLGKTTLVNNLKNVFKDAVFTFEPGGTVFGQKVRELLMTSENISKVTEMYLFASSRSEFVKDVVAPNISSGKMVVSDRFVYSSMVYQGVLGGIGIEKVLEVNESALNGFLPDIVICLCGAKSFRNDAVNRFDVQTDEQTKQINEGFCKLSQMYNNFKLIDVTNLTETEVFEIALNSIKEKLNQI